MCISFYTTVIHNTAQNRTVLIIFPLDKELKNCWGCQSTKVRIVNSHVNWLKYVSISTKLKSMTINGLQQQAEHKNKPTILQNQQMCWLLKCHLCSWNSKVAHKYLAPRQRGEITYHYHPHHAPVQLCWIDFNNTIRCIFVICKYVTKIWNKAQKHSKQVTVVSP